MSHYSIISCCCDLLRIMVWFNPFHTLGQVAWKGFLGVISKKSDGELRMQRSW